MARQGQQVNIKRFDIDLHLAHRLGRVGVEQHTAPSGLPGNIGDRLKCAHLVVGQHDRNQCGIRAQRICDSISRHSASAIDRHDGQLPALCLQVTGSFHDRRVLDGTDDQVPLVGSAGPGHAQQRQVVGFGGAAGKHEVVSSGTDKRGDGPPGRRQPFGSGLAAA